MQTIETSTLLSLAFNERTDLCEIMTSSGSDKARTEWHNYTVLYTHLFEPIRNRPLTVFELGLGTNFEDVPSSMRGTGTPGGSLRGWAAYFPNASIYGADIDRRILFSEPRIRTYYCDQTNAQEVHKMWQDIPDCDIIIEDGLHKFDANKVFFENSVHKLKVGGYFIIEDITRDDAPLMKMQVQQWRDKFPYLDIVIADVPHAENNWDNRLLIAHYSARNL